MREVRLRIRGPDWGARLQIRGARIRIRCTRRVESPYYLVTGVVLTVGLSTAMVVHNSFSLARVAGSSGTEPVSDVQYKTKAGAEPSLVAARYLVSSLAHQTLPDGG